MLKTDDGTGLTAGYLAQMKSCEICDGAEWVVLQRRGRTADAGVYGNLPIRVCERCGHVMQNPRYADRFYQDYYKELYQPDRGYIRPAGAGSTPARKDIDEQIFRATGVLDYVRRFVTPPGRMLDHGCAAGGTMVPFRNAGWECVGIDPHLPSVEVGRKCLGFDIRTGVGEALPFPDAAFDLIFSLGSTEHAYNFGRMMVEARRVLVPGGCMLIRWRSNTLWGSPLEYFNHNHYRFFSPQTWRLALRRYGFSVVDDSAQEFECKPGEVYLMARADLEPSLDAVVEAIGRGEGGDAKVAVQELKVYREAFYPRCLNFLEFCGTRNGDVTRIAAAAREGKIDYRVLLGDDDWAVARAMLEAQRYVEEYEASRVI